MLVCTIITYNDFPLIKLCIESVINKVDKIIVIDGKYIDYPGTENYSTDGTTDYLLSMQKVCNLQLFFGNITDEVSKRNQYLDLVNEGDTVLNLDADEVLIGEIPELKKDWAIVNLQDGHGKHIQHRASRLFKYKDGIHYQNTHCTLYTGDGVIINKLQQVVNPEFSVEHIKDFTILHNWHLRSSERQYYKSLYYRKLVKSESGQVK